MARVSITAAATTVASVTGSIAATHFVPVFVITAVLIGIVLAGVVLPAVWSVKPARRAAALAVLRELLRTANHNEPPSVSASKRPAEDGTSTATSRSRQVHGR